METMRVRLTTGRAWTDEQGRAQASSPGDEIALPIAEARKLLEGEQAVPVAEKPSERAEKRGPGRPRKQQVI